MPPIGPALRTLFLDLADRSSLCTSPWWEAIRHSILCAIFLSCTNATQRSWEIVSQHRLTVIKQYRRFEIWDMDMSMLVRSGTVRWSCIVLMHLRHAVHNLISATSTSQLRGKIFSQLSAPLRWQRRIGYLTMISLTLVLETQQSRSTSLPCCPRVSEKELCTDVDARPRRTEIITSCIQSSGTIPLLSSIDSHYKIRQYNMVPQMQINDISTPLCSIRCSIIVHHIGSPQNTINLV